MVDINHDILLVLTIILFKLTNIQSNNEIGWLLNQYVFRVYDQIVSEKEKLLWQGNFKLFEDA